MLKKKTILIIASIIAVVIAACVTTFILFILPKDGNIAKINYSTLNLTEKSSLDKILVKSPDQYLAVIGSLNISEYNAEQPNLDFAKNDYILDVLNINSCSEELIGVSLDITKNVAAITYNIENSCGYCADESILVIVPVAKSTVDDIIRVKQNFETIDVRKGRCGMTVDKPILYLYPKTVTDINVKIRDESKIITSYPKYNGGWDVTAQPNGDLLDIQGKYYYSLYWDEQNSATVDFSTGFYVEKSGAIQFLEDKLTLLGLNDKERNEFIMYWLPILEKNGKNLVYFELTDERQANNMLTITPTPDSLLRINMHIKKVAEYTKIAEQPLLKFNRIGFTAIEWGGTIH